MSKIALFSSRLHRFIAFLCAVALLFPGCSGSNSKPSNTPPGSAGVAPHETIGGVDVDTQAVAGGYRTTLRTASGETHVMDWAVQNGSTQLTYHLPTGADLGPITFDGIPEGAGNVTLVAYYIYRSRLASGPTASVGLGVRVDAVSFTGPTGPDSCPGSGPFNVAGCNQLQDVFPMIDCRAKGRCCDVHDECITRSCTGPGDSGNIRCLLGNCSPDCARCHLAAISCMLSNAEPGPGKCCGRQDCGKAQECMIDGVVITNPCECQNYRSADFPNGIPSRTPCGSQWLLISLEGSGTAKEHYPASGPAHEFSMSASWCARWHVTLPDPLEGWPDHRAIAPPDPGTTVQGMSMMTVQSTSTAPCSGPLRINTQHGPRPGPATPQTPRIGLANVEARILHMWIDTFGGYDYRLCDGIYLLPVGPYERAEPGYPTDDLRPNYYKFDINLDDWPVGSNRSTSIQTGNIEFHVRQPVTFGDWTGDSQWSGKMTISNH